MTTTTPRRHGLLVVAVLGGMFLALLDQNIVNTALPQIVRELGGASWYTWVVTAYLLTSTVTIPIYGRLSDRYGPKRLLLIGLGLFLAGSALCGAAQDLAQLIAFRAVQGLGAGALMPISLTLIADMFRSGRAGRLSAMIGIVLATSYVAGPALGGLFTDHTGWRWVFLVNVPLTAAVLAVVAVTLPRNESPPQEAKPDYLGMLVFTAAMALVILGLTEAGRGGWLNVSVIVSLCVGAALLVLFGVHELRTANPIVPLWLFRNPAFAVTNLASFCTAFALYTAMVFLPRYFQSVWGVSATTSGLLVYPLLLGLVVGNVVTGSVIGRTRRYKKILLAALVSLCTGSLLMTFLEPETSAPALGFWMLLIGFGAGPMLSCLTILVQDVVPFEHTGVASASLTFFRQIGGMVALTIAETLYAAVIRAEEPVNGTRIAEATATAEVIAVLGVFGGLISLVAFAPRPEWPLWTGAANEMVRRE